MISSIDAWKDFFIPPKSGATVGWKLNETILRSFDIRVEIYDLCGAMIPEVSYDGGGTDHYHYPTIKPKDAKFLVS